MTTAAKLYGKDLTEYDEIDVDQLLAQLSAEEITMLAKEVDPDDSMLPPSQRCSYECEKQPTGPLNRKKLIEHINKQALETPDIPEIKPYVPGTVRGKKWIPPPTETLKEKEAEEQITIDLGDEYETALSTATQEEIIDLAAILGFHSMMNQDQYHASLLNKGQPVGLGWDGITKATQPKAFPMEPPNDTDVDKTIQMVKDDDSELIHLNWNNIKNISDEKFTNLFMALRENTHLETLSLVNVGLTDRQGLKLADSIEKNNVLRVLNVETNFLSPSVVVRLVKALLVQRAMEEFRASNQRCQVLGNKIEMEITSLVEQNPTLLRLGLHLEYNDARQRIATHLQRNIDRKMHHREQVLNRTQKPVDIYSLLGIENPLKESNEFILAEKAKKELDRLVEEKMPKLVEHLDTKKVLEDRSVELNGTKTEKEITEVSEGQIASGEPTKEEIHDVFEGLTEDELCGRSFKVVEHPTCMRPRSSS